MEIMLKKAAQVDREQCLAVEKAAMKNHCYLGDVWSYFHTTTGELTCAYIEGVMVGIGKFTLLYDGTAWLETLRVDPKYQGMGVGKAIYARYFEQAKQYGCKSMAMYTGDTNIVSAGLARKHGFSKVQSFRGYVLADFAPDGEEYPFTMIAPEEAEKRILAMREAYHDYLVFNRTFYKLGTETAHGLAMDGKVFAEEGTDNFIVCGARFQHLHALHIAMMGGDYARCLQFAKRFAGSHGINKLICTMALPNAKLEAFLQESGFAREASDLITMEITR